MRYNIFGTFTFVVFLTGSIFAIPDISYAQNASLSIRPAGGVYPVGEPFTVDVRIDTSGNVVGTVDATIAYDPSDVSYVSVSDEGSVFSRISVDSETSYGKVSISGFIEYGQSGYSGNDGLVARVTFIPLRNAVTQLHFASGGATPPLALGASVGSLANILSSLQSASFTFAPKESVSATALYASAEEKFEITPLPVPENEWFGTTSVKLSWTVPSGATEMKTGVSVTEGAMPETLYQVPVNSETVHDLKEGLQYFLLQFGFGGTWGEVIRYPVRVDLSSPSYIIVKETDRADPADPRAAFLIEAADAYSGVDHYGMSIDGGEENIWNDSGDGMYKPEGLSPGEHVLTARVFDRVGNSTSTDTLFFVKSLDSPILINESVPERVLVGDVITVRGNTYPDSEVTTFISYNDGEASEKKVTSNENGEFTVTVTEGARAGKYTLWFMVTDKRGAMSPNSIKRSIDVSQPYIMLFGSIAVTYLSVIVPLIALILLLGLVLWLGYTWIRGYRGRVKRETNDAYRSTREEFDGLRKELIKQIGMLEKANQSRELTREEMRIFNDLSKRLDKMERRITEEIEDIETVEEEAVGAVERTHSVEGALAEYREKLKQSEVSVVSDSHTIRL